MKTKSWTGDFKRAVQYGFAHYSDFTGRASRAQFWYWFLFAFLAGFVSGLIDMSVFHVTDPTRNGPVGALVTLGLLVPGLSMNVRRLHDVDRSGWWLLIAFTGIGAFVLFYWYLKKGDDAINRFGGEAV